MPRPRPTTRQLPPPQPPKIASQRELRTDLPPPPDKPSARWETLYVYAFLVKFMPPKVSDIDEPTDFEDALLQDGFHKPLFDVLARFMVKLRPELENALTPENISEELIQTVEETSSKIKERGIWWDDATKSNNHPFKEGDDFFSLNWEVKLETLRQFVDWVIAYSSIKDAIDISWEVKYQRKKKKTNKTLAAEFAPPSADDPMSIENLTFAPIGQDSKRTRFWTIDDSPRLYASNNPWRAFCPLYAVSSNREEYVEVLQSIKSTVPPIQPSRQRPKFELAHEELGKLLEARLEKIDQHSLELVEEKQQRKLAEEERLREEEEALAIESAKAARKAGSSKSRRKSSQKQEHVGGEETPADTLVASPDDSQSIASQSTVRGPPMKLKSSKSRASMPTMAPAKSTGKRKRRATSPIKKPDDDEEVDELADDSEGDEEDPLPIVQPEMPLNKSSKPPAKALAPPAVGTRKSSRLSSFVQESVINDTGTTPSSSSTPVSTNPPPSSEPESRRSSRRISKRPNEEEVMSTASSSTPSSKRIKLAEESAPKEETRTGNRNGRRSLVASSNAPRKPLPKPDGGTRSLPSPKPAPSPSGTKSTTVDSSSLTRTPKLPNGGWTVLSMPQDTPNSSADVQHASPTTNRRSQASLKRSASTR